jgi:hypothetical protein
VGQELPRRSGTVANRRSNPSLMIPWSSAISRLITEPTEH